jgi:hypothetical protein
VFEQWLQALGDVCSIVWQSKSIFGGSDRSVLAAPSHLGDEYDIIVSGLASVAFFFPFPFLIEIYVGLLNFQSNPLILIFFLNLIFVLLITICFIWNNL